MRTVGIEGRCFVLSANQCVRGSELPEWIAGENKGQSQDITVGKPQNPARKLSITTEGPHEIVWPQTHSEVQGQSQGQDQAEDSLAPSSSVRDYVCRGGSCIVSPLGEVLAGPLWEVCTDDVPDSSDAAVMDSALGMSMSATESSPTVAVGDGLAIACINLDDCERGRLDLDVAGSYSRSDAFKFEVEGLDLAPPPL
jgi:nitrilase